MSRRAAGARAGRGRAGAARGGAHCARRLRAHPSPSMPRKSLGSWILIRVIGEKLIQSPPLCKVGHVLTARKQMMVLILCPLPRSETAGGAIGGERGRQHDERRERSERSERGEWSERSLRALLGRRQAAAPARTLLAPARRPSPRQGVVPRGGAARRSGRRAPGAGAALAGPGARAAPRPRLRRVARRARPSRVTVPVLSCLFLARPY